MRTSTPKLRNTSVFRLATPKRNNPNHSSAVYPGRPSPGFYFPHLALAAFAAIFRRCSGVKAFALAFPPFSPPARRLDGCLFDSLTVSSASPMAISNTCLASWTGSRGRLATKRVCHRPRRRSTVLDFKLRHYQSALCQGQIPSGGGSFDCPLQRTALGRGHETYSSI